MDQPSTTAIHGKKRCAMRAGKGETKMTAFEVENALRKEYWLNHGCEIGDLYGDDGEMQCGACHPFVDFKREDLDFLSLYVHNKRTLKGLLAMKKLTDARCKE